MTCSKSTAERIRFVSNTRNKSLALALYNSILDQDLNEIEFLLKQKRTNSNYLIPEYGITPLHCAIGVGSEDHAFKVVSFILCYGGDPNVRCSEGSTPVLIAALWGRLQILKLLLVNRGDPFLIDESGQSALDYAKQNNHDVIYNYLKHWDVNKDAAFGSSSACRNDAVTQTSINSTVSSTSRINSSYDFISCCDLSNADSFKCVKKSSGTFDPVISLPESSFCDNSKNITVNKSNCRFSKDNCGNIDLNEGFIHENLSDLVSDIDSDVNLNQTVSFCGVENGYLSPCKNPNVTRSFVQSNTNLEELENETKNQQINSRNSHSWNDFSHASKSVNTLDAAFIEVVAVNEKYPCEELYTDDEAGIVILQRNFPPVVSDSDSFVTGKSGRSCTSHRSTESYDTDNLTNKLKECKIFSGPITKTTKRVYTRQLKRFMRNECAESNGIGFQTGSVISRTFQKDFLKLIEQWTPLETEMSEDFLKNTVKFRFRGGIAKCFFNYLLLDPSVTNNLPVKANSMCSLEIWKIFIKAVFYVGKGKQSRPYAHLYEALKPRTRKPLSKKVIKILNIWNKKQGVVCLMIFHNTISAEALTREAAMIDALSGGNLTNAQGGEYHGIVAGWNMKRKCQLGAVLLHRALSIYLAEGERQISPPDLEVKPTFRQI